MGADNQARVLLVDDSPENIHILGTILQSDCRVFFATDGKRALALAEKESPDLILLDVVMPDMDGYEVCRALKEMDSTRNIPVIFVTAKDDEQDEAMGLRISIVTGWERRDKPAWRSG
jgi:CheY-like chemotaxis protein